MAKGLSLHIGLNEIDANQYEGWQGQLNACENDARDMQHIAQQLGYATTLLLTKDAVSNAVLKHLGMASQALEAGDIFLLTYSGHGSRIRDISGEEEDRFDETWVLYDRMLADDELYAMWSNFKAGVRILVISDSCHSGTVVKELEARNMLMVELFPAFYDEPERRIYKAMPVDVSFSVFEKNIRLYESIQWLCSSGDDHPVSASIILLAACHDNQTASDGHQNSLFTAILKQVWDEGTFSGSYDRFWKALVERSPATQTPSYYRVGASNQDFESQKPFQV